MEEYPYRTFVEGEWGSIPPKATKNKLQIYFQSKKKSGGGDCQVEYSYNSSGRATVCFQFKDVLERVLAKEEHEITVDDTKVKLRFLQYGGNPEDVTHEAEVDHLKPAESGVSEEGQSGSEVAGTEEPTQARAVVLENVPEKLSREILGMMVENMCNVKEEDFSLEMIQDINTAVLSFNDPSAVEQFLSKCDKPGRFQQYKMMTRVLEPARSVRVENLPPQAVEELLVLFFEKEGEGGGEVAAIQMFPEERAAIITFQDPKVIETVQKKKHFICKVPVSVYPYHESLGTVLYGKDRPMWKMPEAFTESLQHAVWKFLLQKRQLMDINDQMRSHFCQVELDTTNAKISPLPALLKQKGLTANHIEGWRGNALRVFCSITARYRCFECAVSSSVWKVAEKEVRQAVKEDAILVPDQANGVLAVAGFAKDMDRIQQTVEGIIQQATSRMERKRDGIAEEIPLSPGMHYILQQTGLQKTFVDQYPNLSVTYRTDIHKLVLSGLPAEVFAVKSWVLERRLDMKQRPVEVHPNLLGFLSMVDSEKISQNLFTSRGVSAVYKIEGGKVVLLGGSEKALSEANQLLIEALAVQDVAVEDAAVLTNPEWVKIKTQLTEAYNSSKYSTVSIKLVQQGCISVSGFQEPVRKVSDTLSSFITKHSHVEEAVPVRTCAVLKFIQENKALDWRPRVDTETVKIRFDHRRSRVVLGGARFRVQELESLFVQMAASLCTDQLTIVKPGAKKYFLENEKTFFSSMMKEHKCVVLLQEEYEQEEAEEGEWGEEGVGEDQCRVQMDNGVLVIVRKADISRFKADAVVNAANEDLKHIGGLAAALLRVAGRQLQEASDKYVHKNGQLSPGDAAITEAGRLLCKYVIHAVGPRYSTAKHSQCVQLLARSVKNSLTLAEQNGCSSIAIPAISSGIFGFPLQLCANTIAKSVLDHCEASHRSTLTKIHLVNNDDKTVHGMTQAVREVFTEKRVQIMSHQRSSPEVEQRRKSSPPRALGGYHSRAKASGRREDLETKYTKEGLKIALSKGSIEYVSTDVIVNTISKDLDLSQGAVSNAIRQAAGHELQSAIRQETRRGMVNYGDVLHTPGFHLRCEILHTVCPLWDSGTGQAQQTLVDIVHTCLRDAERLRAASLAFPAIGTGNMNFPKSLVAKLMLSEVQAFSHKRAPMHLREVVFMVHHSDTETLECFVKEFKGQTPGQRGPRSPHDSQSQQAKFHTGQSQEDSAFFGQVSSPTLGVHSMEIGHLTLEVSSGDITKETTDIIVNSSNSTFSLKTGVSKAILDAAGLQVESECAQAGSQKHNGLIVSQGGNLQCKSIVHIVGQNDPAKIRDMVYQVLQVCEEDRATSVAFPALGTGQGGVKPSLVAEAMIDAVTDFETKNTGKNLKFVKIVVFQPGMVSEFLKTMKRREGGSLPEEKSILTKMKDKITSIFGGPSRETRSEEEEFVMVGEDFSPTVFQLCGETTQAVAAAKRVLKDLIVREQTEQIIREPGIAHLSQEHRDVLHSLQKRLTVRIQLESRGEASFIRLEGLTRDVQTAATDARQMIREVELRMNQHREAVLVSSLVEWQYEEKGLFVPFDLLTNLSLEQALEKQRSSIKISINNSEYEANLGAKKAFRNRSEISLKRIDLKINPIVNLPNTWESMGGLDLKEVLLSQTSQEYQDVEAEFKRTGLTNKIIKIERIQNETLWKGYQIKKASLDSQNRHTNNQKRLFHGTHGPSVDQINQHGFNRSYAGTHAAAYGNGTYFAVDPKYSASSTYSKPDTQGQRHMYLALVLVGEFTVGSHGMVVPPQKNTGKSTDLYNSVVDNISNPNMFIIFSDVQAYPEYHIVFQ